MSAVQPALFFLGLPDLSKLVCVSLRLQEDEEPRSNQLKTCRELVLLYSEVLASPALDCFTDITVAMAVSFFQKGIIQVFAQRQCLQLGSPQCVLPGVLQSCLSYSLITRLAPRWNKAGLHLISGKNFLADRGRMNAVSMELSTREGQLCVCIEASSVRLPPTALEDFNLAPLVLRRFCSDPAAFLDFSSTAGAIWCHVLPSMKKGQIFTISRQLPRDGPFKSYRELQNHWNSLYGYRLPDFAEEEVVYCNVYFKLVGDRLFTYPLSCIRLQPVQRCAGVDLQETLGSFLSDVKVRLQSVCGFPARLTGKPSYRTVVLNTAATVQDLSAEQVNLSTSSSTRPVPTQLPAPASQILKPVFASQPPAWTPLSQSDQAQGRSQRPLSSSSSSSHAAHSSGYQSASSSSSSSFSSVSLSASSSTFSPSVLSPVPTQTWLSPAPELVPIFKNRRPSRHVNVALLRVQKQRQDGAVDRNGRGTIPTFGKNRPITAPSSFTSASLTVLPPPTILCFRPQGSTGADPSAHGKPKQVFSLSPESKRKPHFTSPLNMKPTPKSNLKTRNDMQGKAAPPEDPPRPPTAAEGKCGMSQA